ncbi:hypothetical protein [Nitrospira moscoviensis]|uniref:Lipoprotein n=1 Tax=Nitrospira moscoviensis TaxID=42253 RepID=A0A0K2GCG6_NITMO|nr:hypothetical protein [Nitrospira moscoviensis]ALA58292.1 hypothetical protein NITMOv2_1872 [Nitrospira moscoviensis]
MRATRGIRSTLVLAALAAGCGGPAYQPDLTLTRSGPIIDATVEMHDLYAAPALMSGKKTFGLEAPDAKRVAPTELAEQVEEELFTELAQAGLFSRVTRFDPQPDLILSGRINALHEHNRPRLWTKIPGVGQVAGALEMKTHVSSGEADLTVYLLKPDGEVVGTYRGQSSFDETFNPTKEVPPGARLNRALSEAVEQIQKKILQDRTVRAIASR